MLPPERRLSHSSHNLLLKRIPDDVRVQIKRVAAGKNRTVEMRRFMPIPTTVNLSVVVSRTVFHIISYRERSVDGKDSP